MKNKIWIMFLSVLVLSGCQTMGKKINNEHTRNHAIDVQVIGENKRFLKAVNLTHRLRKESLNLFLRGDIERPAGALISLVKVKIKFLNENGQIVKEEDRRAYFNRYGSRGLRKYKGAFYVEVSDNEDIVKCEVEFT